MDIEALKLVPPWQFEHVRVTVFPESGSEVDPGAQWEKFGGLAIEHVDAKPRIGATSVVGEFSGARLLLQVDPQKVDWRLLPPATEDDSAELSRVMTPSVSIEAIGGFIEAATAWAAGDASPPIVRAALGVVCVAPMETPKRAYELLGGILPELNLDPDSHSDLIFQLNRRTPSNSFPRMTINRLSRWVVQKIAITATVATSPLSRPIAETVMARRELDINSPVDRQDVLGKDGIRALMSDFIGAASDMLREAGQHA